MIRIAITGPESTGKTTLAKAMSIDLNVSFVPEFAREYLLQLGRSYLQDDLDTIAKGHLDSFISTSSPLQIIDTDFLVMKIWSEEKYTSTSIYIEELVSNNYFDLHILCAPDIPWKNDPLRENPEDRDRLFEIYKQELIDQNKHFITVEGSLEERIQKSREAITIIQN